MKKTAQELARQGRNGDTVLVHMNPEEVAGLQYLALATGGGPLTVNPKTGMVEAFKLGRFFKSFLPMIAGGLLAATGIGAPLAAAMVAGGSTILNKGDWKKGLLDGLSAFGGAGVGQALAGAGKNVAVGGGLEALKQSGGETLKSAAGTTLKETGKAALGTGTGLGMPTAASNFRQGLGLMKTGLQAGTSSLANAGTVASGIGFNTAMAAASKPMSKMAEVAPMPDMKSGPTYYYNTRFNQGQVNPRFGEPGESYFIPQQQYEQGEWTKQFPGAPPEMFDDTTKRAGGGIVPNSYDPKVDAMDGTEAMAGGGEAKADKPNANAVRDYLNNLNRQFTAKNLNPTPRPRVQIKPAPLNTTAVAGLPYAMQGGVGSAMPQYAPSAYQVLRSSDDYSMPSMARGGRLLAGPGDGVSDSIKARIYGRGGQTQEARLADGEYVIDARTVSELGNGSTAAGARKLRNMVKRIHASRRKAKIGKDSKAERHLPA